MTGWLRTGKDGRTGTAPLNVVYGAGNLGKIWTAFGQHELLYK